MTGLTIQLFNYLCGIGLHPYLSVFILVTTYFLSLYLTFSIGAWLLTLKIFPTLKLGSTAVERQHRPGQIRYELGFSIQSCVIFGLIGIFVFAAYKKDFITVEWDPTFSKIIQDLLILIVWNEIHFYLTHRMLHIRPLMRWIHRVHHMSVIPTPFSTYSLHPVEAFLNGIVIVWVMPFYTLSFPAMMLFPLYSIAVNTVAHSNFRFGKSDELLSVRHSSHHARSSVEFGFLLPLIDRFLKTHQESS